MRARPQKTFWRVNEQIHAPKLRVIGPDGLQLGIFSAQEALERAKKKGLDLVEIAPRANPPVAKIIEFDKFKYEQEKRERQARKKEKRGQELKEIRFSPFIADNDYKIRIERIEQFLQEGHKVRVVVKFLGRQMGHRQFGYKLIERITQDLPENVRVEQEPKFLGRHLITTLSATKGARRPKGEKDAKEEKI